MKTEIIEFAGDVPGNAIELRVLRFAGKDSDAPTAYLQSSLHGGELPGQAALHFLVPMLKKASEEGRILGNVTVIPQANPIGSNQWQAHQHLGRFEFFRRSISIALFRFCRISTRLNCPARMHLLRLYSVSRLRF